MKILHLKGFSEAEIQGYRKLVHKNILDNMRLLIKGAETLDIPLDDPVGHDARLELRPAG